MKDRKNILLWGAKSKALILHNMLQKSGEKISYIFDKNVERPDFETDAIFSNQPKNLEEFLNESTHFIVCIGAGEYGKARYLISEKLIEKGLSPLSIISKHSYIDDTSEVGWGLQAMPGSLLHCFSSIGNACILNSNCCIDHDCVIGNGVHIMGSAAIAGRVTIGDYVSIGTNATILPDITIGHGAFIGAGALVHNDVMENEVVIGNPAKFLKMNDHKYDLSDFE